MGKVKARVEDYSWLIEMATEEILYYVCANCEAAEDDIRRAITHLTARLLAERTG